ncbi:carbohydrate-binding module family 20 protein [Pleomassaria siparia CBS 279.74]|uniref:glucan 1,4-alpha-glucosidase n=1 Tax=Pleomassaria siparia CBS 279.74 TaxID=1314801 RepID=A0A6G1JS33_9PLEO|nr:carbohydrate-binding module family 20 protein [Pleomassaria siparia CBS 279.74]
MDQCGVHVELSPRDPKRTLCFPQRPFYGIGGRGLAYQLARILIKYKRATSALHPGTLASFLASQFSVRVLSFQKTIIMRLSTLVAAFAAASFHEAAARLGIRQDNLPAAIENENTIALQGVLDNIGPDGSHAPGAAAGAIVASPSTEDPDYFFTWTRDAALTTKMLIDELIHGNTNLRSHIQDYLRAQAILQTVSNPSGALSSGRGLGEPKYYLNLTRFNGPWGRPQRDGPALRATALITYARYLLATGQSDDASEAKDKVWPVVQNDLNYVAQYWNSTGFDLWEEVSGSSFFATAVQHRALVEGSALGKSLGVNSTAAYDSQAPNILCFLQTFWNGQYVVANINTQSGFSRTGIDANTVLTSIATFDPEAPCSDALFQPCSSRALSNLKAYIDSFRTIYTINHNTTNSSGVATGRYAEDVYYGGNPWYLTTLAVAEQIYDAVQRWNADSCITITSLDLPFWQSLSPSAVVGSHSGYVFTSLRDAALKYADAFVATALKYTPSSGALAEQYSRENGTAISARDLTWSYASFVTMRSARLAATSNYEQVPSWGSSSGNTVPDVCIASSVPGVYTPAVAAGAPPGSGGCTVLVTFNVNATTYFGEDIYLSGSGSDLGNWNPSDALSGSAINYSADRPLWSFTVELPANSTLGYRYLRKESDGSYLYETSNRTLAVAPCASGDTATVEDAWVGPVGVPPN